MTVDRSMMTVYELYDNSMEKYNDGRAKYDKGIWKYNDGKAKKNGARVILISNVSKGVKM